MTLGIMRWPWGPLGVALAGLATVAILYVPAEAISKRSISAYLGQASAGTASEIRLEVDMRRGKPHSATFAAMNVNLTCEDGTTRDWTPGFDPIKLGFHGSGQTFDGRRYQLGHPIASEIFMRIHGRLLAEGRAEGYVVIYLNPWDPPGQVNDPECTTTGGQQTWSAERE